MKCRGNLRPSGWFLYVSDEPCMAKVNMKSKVSEFCVGQKGLIELGGKMVNQDGKHMGKHECWA